MATETTTVDNTVYELIRRYVKWLKWTGLNLTGLYD